MKKKRLLSLLVALAMCVSLLPQAAWAEDAEISGEPMTRGMGDGSVAPQAPAERAQVAMMLMKFMQL